MYGINYRVIPHNQHRYPTIGDYWIDENGVWQIRVSMMLDWRHEFLVFFHECIELAWCNYNNVSELAVKAFDEEYERNRRVDDTTSEPGDQPDAPYFMGHQLATMCEHVAAFILNVNWKHYTDELASLDNPSSLEGRQSAQKSSAIALAFSKITAWLRL